MSIELYYTPPSDKMFNEIKREAIKIWQTYDDTYGYATKKIDSIKDIKNVKDNYMYMVAMFDECNQAKLLTALSAETSRRVLEAKS